MSTVFAISNYLVLPFWVLMIFAPRWRWTAAIMRSPLVVLGPVLIYVALVVPRWNIIFPTVANPSLAKIASLLGTPEGAIIAWMHFLAFDLFVGRHVYLDSRTRDISPWLMAPVLFLVLMIGPAGFLLYLVVSRSGKKTAEVL
jgi:Domain of unknown function (DUF4281)